MISLVVLTFNSAGHIRACLSAVTASGVSGLEIIVVDNGSTDTTVTIIRDEYPDVLVVPNQLNMGASKARNQGVALAQGAWIMTLDSDVVLAPGFLREFLLAEKGFQANIGMVQANILDEDGGRIYSQGVQLSLWRRFHDINRGKPATAVHPGVRRILGPCSAAAFYRREMLDQVREATGYFDERFFFLVEDVDLAWRARRAGWGVAFLPEAKCRHTGNGSATTAQRRQYLSFRNRFLMIYKNESLWRRVGTYALSWPYDVTRFLYMLLFNPYLRQEK